MGKDGFANPKPKVTKKRHLKAPLPAEVDESPVLIQSAASDDGSAIVKTRCTEFRSGRALSFNPNSYSKRELAELKARLIEELDKIRQLKSRVDYCSNAVRSSDYQKRESAFAGLMNVAGMKGKSVELGQFKKNLGEILRKLMMHKDGHIFNKPVDVVGMKLYDYFDVIKSPMDLGTVKAKLGKNLYPSPHDFAADIRLTFYNAMTYNPVGHQVHALAQQFLGKFEKWYQPIDEKLMKMEAMIKQEHDQEVQVSSWDQNHSDPENFMEIIPSSNPIIDDYPPIPVVDSNRNKLNHSSNQMLLPSPSPVRVLSAKPVKQPKPKARDPNKREMDLEEKQRLSIGLQNLPQEKMDQVVQIVKKRNGLRQEGDEIELDIEAIDTETLWELDRFVTNYKKLASKIKRQALMGLNNAANSAININADSSLNQRVEMMDEMVKMREVRDEEVDIGDDTPVGGFPPVEIGKDDHPIGSRTSSSGSSDDSSSSSESGSDSSSSTSDSDDARS